MYKLLNYFSTHPWLALLIIALLSAVSVFQLESLEVKISADEMLVMDDENRHFYDKVRKTFGDEEASLLFLQSDDLLAKDKLDALAQVLDRLQAMPFVERIESLFTIPHVRTVDGYLDKEPYLAAIPASKQVADELLTEAWKNPFLKNILISEDKKIMAAAIIMSDDPGGMDDQTITSIMQSATDDLEVYYDSVFSIGFPHIRTEIADRLRQEQGALFPLAIAALLIALFLMLRQLLDILIPILTAGFSILWTLGFMGATGIPLNVVTSIVPILLIIVGSTEDIHLLSEFRHAQKRGLNTQNSLKQMARRMGGIVLLTFFTTYLGFLSVGLSGIEVLWQFGITASTGLLLNFTATILCIPAVLSLAGKWQLDGKSRLFELSSKETAAKYWGWLWRNRTPIIVLFILITLTAAAGIPKIKINHNPIDSLGQHSTNRKNIEAVNEHLAGLETLSIVIDSGIEDTFLKVRYLDELVAIQEHIKQQDWSRSTTSFADYLAVVNGAFQELDDPLVPQTDDVVTELMIFLDQNNIREYIKPDFSEARILVRHAISNTDQLQSSIDDLQAFIDHNLDSGLRARITGDSVLSLSATHSMITGQLKSIGILLIIIVFIIALLFTEIKVGLLAAIPNLFPLIILFGVMGYAEIPLNIGTTMAAAIAIGIAVDDTLHFMLRYNAQLKHVKSHADAMRNTIYSEALPVLSTSIALISGFLVFTFSTFEPIRQFGLLGALVIASALIADFIITPLTISSLRLVTIWDMLSLSIRRQVLAKSTLFKGMKPWQIRQFILSGTVLELDKDDYVFRIGDTSNALYLLLTGKVEICMPASGDAPCLSLEQFTPGDVFGDVALFANIPRQTDAVVKESASMLLLTREGIEMTTRHRPIISARIFSNLTADVSRRMVKLISKQQIARKKQAMKSDEQNS